MNNRKERKKAEGDKSWINALLSKIKKNQPVNVTGLANHVLGWSFSHPNGYHYINGDKKNISSSTTSIKQSLPETERKSDELTIEENIKTDKTDLEVENEFENKNSKDGTIEIICVHGTMDRANAFNPIAKKLLRAPLPNNINGITLLSYTDRFYGVSNEAYAKQTADLIKQMLMDKKLKSNKVYFMGHSRGVLIILLFAVMYAKEMGLEILGFFDLGGPLFGSPAANKMKFLAKSINEMQENSEFLKNLIPRVIELNIPHYFYAAEYDWLVPLRSCFLKEWCENLVLLRRHGHLSMLSSNRCVEHMLKVFYGEDMTLSPATALEEIKEFIEEELKERYHAWSTDQKIYILEKLRYYLKATIAEYYLKDTYPEAKTVGAFINAFMHDKEILKNGKLPIEELNVHLNLIRWSKNTASYTFITCMIERYQRIPLKALPRLNHSENKHQIIENNENNKISEIQSPRQNF